MSYRRQDPVYRRAKAAGYRARSAYKLIELDRRFRLLGPGDAVVDLGAWPGGWLQVSLERVGPKGRVVGVDAVPIDPLGAPNLRLVSGDVRDPEVITAARRELGTAASIVLCDLAPKLTGVQATDEARCAELTGAVLAALPVLLRRGGRLVMKLFMDAGHRATMARLRGGFASVRAARPQATREGSAETYAVAIDFQSTAACAQPVD